jgi:hypothetical protein
LETKEETGVRRTINAALVAAAVAICSVAAIMPSATRAEVSISIDPGVIAFGYSDGYWDRDHHWHRWHNRQDARWYRAHYGEHYYNRRHDRDHDAGWREHERWWDHH